MSFFLFDALGAVVTMLIVLVAARKTEKTELENDT